MNELITLILQIFGEYLHSTFIYQDDKSYTYKEIYKKIKRFKEDLNNISPNNPIKIALIANNSVEWVIAFISILLSRHTLILFTPNTSLLKITHVVNNSKATILITDLTILNKQEFPLLKILIPISNLLNVDEYDFNAFIHPSKEVVLLEDMEYAKQNNIIIYSEYELRKVIISEYKILQLLQYFKKECIFEHPFLTENYVTNVEFTYNYVLGLLAPMQGGCEICISKGNNPYQIEYDLRVNAPRTVVLTAIQFEELWRTFIDNPTSKLNNFLKKIPISFFRNIYLKKQFEKVFPGLSLLVILNSRLKTTTEDSLWNLGIPYISTYGNIETCGLSTFSKPEEFTKYSCGSLLFHTKIHNSDDTVILFNEEDTINTEDVLYEGQNSSLYFKYKKTEIADISSTLSNSNIERVLNQLSLIKDCIIGTIKGKNILLVSIDLTVASYLKLSYESIILILENRIELLNEYLDYSICIDKIYILPNDFKRDTYGRIIREYYN